MNALATSSTYRNHAQPKERITPHQVLALSNKFGGKDHDLLIALKNQMIDDIRQRVALRALIVSGASKEELLKAIDEEKK